MKKQCISFTISVPRNKIKTEKLIHDIVKVETILEEVFNLMPVQQSYEKYNRIGIDFYCYSREKIENIKKYLSDNHLLKTKKKNGYTVKVNN